VEKSTQQKLMIGGGLAIVAALGYWWYSSKKAPAKKSASLQMGSAPPALPPAGSTEQPPVGTASQTPTETPPGMADPAFTAPPTDPQSTYSMPGTRAFVPALATVVDPYMGPA